MRTWLIVLCPLVLACDSGTEVVRPHTIEVVRPHTISKQSKAAAHSNEEPPRNQTPSPSTQLTGMAGAVRVRIATNCNCAGKTTLDVTTTDKLITIQGVLPDGPLARCVEPCVLFAQATELSPGNYRVIYLPPGEDEPLFSGEVEVH
jgi:hypothetical protein